MPEVPASFTRTINLSVIGYGANTPTTPLRVGKSCLIQRFMNRGRYTEDHLSIISNSDYYSSVIATQSWIYWGSRELNSGSNKFRIRVIEQCEFFDDHLFTQYDKRAYTERCFATRMRIDSPKVAYLSKDQVGHEWKYTRESLENYEFVVDAFVIVFDPTLTGFAAENQKKFLKTALSKMKEMKMPFVIASAKHDSAPLPENIKSINDLVKKHTRYHGKLKYCRVELSARLNINVEQAFLGAAMLCVHPDNSIIGKYFAFPSTPISNFNDEVSDKWSGHGDIMTLYMNPSSCQSPQPSERLLVNNLQRISLAYDLPIEIDSGSPKSSIRGSKVCVLPSSAPTNGAFQIHQHHDHICEIQNSNAAGIVTARIPLPPAIRLPTNRTHFVPIRESAYKEADGQGLSQNKQTPCLLMLFLSGPGAQGLKGYFKSHVQHDCFELSDGERIRLWIFDERESLNVQISPSKWEPRGVLKPSPSAPSAFSTPAQNNCSIARRQSLGNNDFRGCMKLSLWITGLRAEDICSTTNEPKNVNAVIFRSSVEEPNDVYYDQIAGDPFFEFQKTFELAKNLGVPLFFLSEVVPPSILTELYFFANSLPSFKASTECAPFAPPVFISDISDLRLPLLTQVCNLEPGQEDFGSIILAGAHSCCSGGLTDTDLLTFRAVPRVAVGISFSKAHTHTPLVIFGTTSQALEMLSHFPRASSNDTGRVCFLAVHFNTPQWPRFCAELTSQLESFMHGASECLRRQKSASKTGSDNSVRCVILLVAIGADNASRVRQFLHSFSAENACLLWTPRSSWECCPDPPAFDNHLHQQITQGIKPSLAFIHLQSENDEDFRGYQQAMRGDMSAWQASYASGLTFMSPSATEANNRLPYTYSCETCRQRCALTSGGSSSSLLPRHHLHISDCPDNQHCCAFALSGRNHDEYADPGAPILPDDNGTEEMLQVHSQPTSSHPRISTIIGSSCDDNISEQYAEKSPPLPPVSDRPRRPQMTRQCTISATSSSSPVSLTLSSATASHRIGHLRPQQIGSSSFYMRPSASPLPLSSSSSSLSASSLAPPLLDASDRGFTLIHPRNSTNNNASTPTNTTGRSFSEISEFMSPRLLTAQHACNQPPDGEDAYETVYEEPILCIDRSLIRSFDREDTWRQPSLQIDPRSSGLWNTNHQGGFVSTPLSPTFGNSANGWHNEIETLRSSTAYRCARSVPQPIDHRRPIQKRLLSATDPHIEVVLTSTTSKAKSTDRSKTIALRFGHALKRGGEAIRGLSTKFLKDKKGPL